MKLRRVVTTLGLAAGIVALPFATLAQSTAKVVRIGFLAPGGDGAGSPVAPVAQWLKELGYIDGKNAIFESRHDAGQPGRLPELAAELVRLKVDVIVAIANAGAFAAKNATRTIPIVVWGAHGALETGLVTSLARPQGNITGVESLAPEVDAKRVQLLQEIVPELTRLAVLYNVGDPGSPVHLKYTRDAGRKLKVEVASLELQRPEDVDPVLASMTGSPPGGLLTFTDPLTFIVWPRVAAFALQQRLPTMCEFKPMAQAGCLISYGPTFGEFHERVARQVDRILKGTRPGELPIEQPTKFELVINLKTAKALGITIPQSVLVRADEVIE